jgi:hypothetical protein
MPRRGAKEIMSNHAITSPVPDYIYDRARLIAEDTSQPIEAVLVRQLENALPSPCRPWNLGSNGG